MVAWRGFALAAMFSAGSAQAALYPMDTPVLLKTCGMTGSAGPSLSQCQNAYAGKPWASPSFFQFGHPQVSQSVASVWQQLLLPQAGTYAITAAGCVPRGGPCSLAHANVPSSASGASLNAYNGRCRGAVVTVTVTLRDSTMLYVMVGQKGVPEGNIPGGRDVGGGGGTFVLLSDGTVLVAAGGGGGTDAQHNMPVVRCAPFRRRSASPLTLS